MSTHTVFVDPMPGIKSWAATEDHIAAVNDDRAFFVTPHEYDTDAPDTWLVLSLVDVHDDDTTAAIEIPVVQFDCYGRTGELAGRLRAAVKTAVHNFAGRLTAAGVVIHAAEVMGGGQWMPEPDSNRPQFVLTARFLTSAAA